MKKILTKANLKNVVQAMFIICGTFLMGMAFNVFLNNNKISPSGFAGLSSIVSNLLKSNFNIYIPAGVFYLSINAVLFVLSIKSIGLKFAVNSLIGIVSYSIFMEVCNFDIGLAGTDLLLCAIYGGVLMGFGLGLVFRCGGSTGGSDMLANLLRKKFKFITVGSMVFIVDFVVVSLSFLAYNNLELAMYSVVAIWIMTKMSDMVASGVYGLKAYYIISSKSQEIANAILTDVERGVTSLKATGMYTHEDHDVLLVVLSRAEAIKLRKIISEIDTKSFVFSAPISEAMGTGFLPHDIPKKNSQKNKKTN